MENVVLNVTQAFQLSAIGPCFFIAIYLLSSSRNISLTFIPAMYFLALGTSFLRPIVKALPELKSSHEVEIALLFVENLLPELSFMLIVQFILGVRPPLIYWLIFAIPVIGGSPFLYLMPGQEEVCLLQEICYPPRYFLLLYKVFGASLVFMLLVAFMGKRKNTIPESDVHRRAKYWLIIALIAFNLILIALDLMEISESAKPDQLVFIRTMIGITFVYLILSSVFRVFSESFGLRPIRINYRQIFTLKDMKISEKLELVMQEEKPYTKSGFNRKTLADMLDVQEHQLSRVINYKFKKSFSELTNEYRVEEAKNLLRKTESPITVISFDTGFNNLTSFNRVFKKATGKTPTQYREEAKLS